MTLLRLVAGRMFKSVRAHRNFRLFFFGQIISVCGTWMQNIALYWLILELTHSPVAVGLLSLARFGPFALMGLFTGVLADRFDNRKTVMVTQAAQMICAAVLAAITLLGTARAWEVLTIAVLIGVADVVDVPVRQNFIVQLVGRSELSNAIALNATLGNAARTLGPALAGLVIATVGTGWCFAINSVSFLGVIAALALMRTSELFPLLDRGRPSLLKGTREGLAYARRSRPVLVAVAITVIVISFAFNVNVLLPIVTRQTLGAGPETLGIITSCFGVGAIFGALVSAAVARPRWRLILGGAGAVGLLDFVLARLHNVYAVAPLLFLCGICFTTYAAASNATVQLETPDHIRGRVLGLYLYAWNGPTAFASPLLGWLCAVGGTRLAFAFSGTCALAVTGIGAVVLRRPGRPGASSEAVVPVLASPPLN